MTELRRADIAYEAACRIISPREVRVLVSLACALLLAVLYLWNESRTQWSWIISLNTKISKLQAESQVADALNRQARAIEELAILYSDGSRADKHTELEE